MSTERTRRVGAFFGTVLLLVQALVLWRFLQEVNREIDTTPWVAEDVLWNRLAWLKAAPWQPRWFKVFAYALGAVAGGTVLALWAIGVRRAWQTRRAHGGRP